MGTREDFLTELRNNLSAKGILAITKESNPPGGEVIKIKGIALYKILRTSNPFGNEGIAIHRNLDEAIISHVGGKRSKGKNGWVAAPLSSYNYQETMEALVELAEKVNATRNLRMTRARKSRSKGRKRRDPLNFTEPISTSANGIEIPEAKPLSSFEPPPRPETVPKKKSTKNLRKKKNIEDNYDDMPF